MEELFNTETKETFALQHVDKNVHKKCYDSIWFVYEHQGGWGGDCIYCTHESRKYKIAPSGAHYVMCNGFNIKGIK